MATKILFLSKVKSDEEFDLELFRQDSLSLKKDDGTPKARWGIFDTDYVWFELDEISNPDVFGATYFSLGVSDIVVIEKGYLESYVDTEENPVFSQVVDKIEAKKGSSSYFEFSTIQEGLEFVWSKLKDLPISPTLDEFLNMGYIGATKVGEEEIGEYPKEENETYFIEDDFGVNFEESLDGEFEDNNQEEIEDTSFDSDQGNWSDDSWSNSDMGEVGADEVLFGVSSNETQTLPIVGIPSEELKPLLTSVVTEVISAKIEHTDYLIDSKLTEFGNEFIPLQEKLKSLDNHYASLIDKVVEVGNLVQTAQPTQALGVSANNSALDDYMHKVLLLEQEKAILNGQVAELGEKLAKYCDESGNLLSPEEIHSALDKLRSTPNGDLEVQRLSVQLRSTQAELEKSRERVIQLEKEVEDVSPFNSEKVELDIARGKIAELQNNKVPEGYIEESEFLRLQEEYRNLNRRYRELRRESKRAPQEPTPENSRRVEVLNDELSKLERQLDLKRQDFESLERDFATLEEKNSTLLETISKQEKELSQIPQLKDTIYNLNEENRKLVFSKESAEEKLESYKRDLLEANKRLTSMGSGVSSGRVESKGSSDLTNITEPMVGMLWDNANNKFSNVEFVVSGSTHDRKLTYLELVDLSKKEDLIVLDLSVETDLDYRFGANQTRSAIPWITGKGNLSSAVFTIGDGRNTKLIAIGVSPFNTSVLPSIDWVEKFRELDKIGTRVIVYCGDLSNSFTRELVATALGYNRVTVYTYVTPTNLRTTYFSLKSIYGSGSASILLFGNKQDEVSKKIIGAMVKDGLKLNTKEGGKAVG